MEPTSKPVFGGMKKGFLNTTQKSSNRDETSRKSSEIVAANEQQNMTTSPQREKNIPKDTTENWRADQNRVTSHETSTSNKGDHFAGFQKGFLNVTKLTTLRDLPKDKVQNESEDSSTDEVTTDSEDDCSSDNIIYKRKVVCDEKSTSAKGGNIGLQRPNVVLPTSLGDHAPTDEEKTQLRDHAPIVKAKTLQLPQETPSLNLKSSRTLNQPSSADSGTEKGSKRNKKKDKGMGLKELQDKVRQNENLMKYFRDEKLKKKIHLLAGKNKDAEFIPDSETTEKCDKFIDEFAAFLNELLPESPKTEDQESK